jgi:hypothetical protein
MKLVIMLDSNDLDREIGVDMLDILADTYDPPSNGSVHMLWDLHRRTSSEIIAEYGNTYGEALVKIKEYLKESMPDWTDQEVYVHCNW